MRWQRYIWTATILAIWIVSLMIVDSAAKQTRMGYQQQKLQLTRQNLEETSLRLQCEMSVLHDLEKADMYADSQGMQQPEAGDLVIADQRTSQE